MRGLADLQPAPDAVLPALKKSVQDPDKNVADAAVHVLGSLGDPAIPALSDALNARRFAPSRPGFSAKWDRGEVGAPALAEIAKVDRIAAAQSEALLALAAIGADSAIVVPVAVDALRSPQEDVCCAACFALGRLGKPACGRSPNCERSWVA